MNSLNKTWSNDVKTVLMAADWSVSHRVPIGVWLFSLSASSNQRRAKPGLLGGKSVPLIRNASGWLLWLLGCKFFMMYPLCPLKLDNEICSLSSSGHCAGPLLPALLHHRRRCLPGVSNRKGSGVDDFYSPEFFSGSRKQMLSSLILCPFIIASTAELCVS